MSRFTLKAIFSHLPENLPNRSAFSPACRLRYAVAQRTLYILDFYVIDKLIFFTDARFDVLTSIGADYDGTQKTKPAYFDVICPKCRCTEIVDIQK
jgi:hypothetical protein